MIERRFVMTKRRSLSPDRSSLVAILTTHFWRTSVCGVIGALVIVAFAVRFQIRLPSIFYHAFING